LLFGGRGGSGGLKKTPEQKNKLKRLEKLNGDPRYEGEEFWPEDLKQMRTPIMAGNWKCNPKTLDEARTLASLVAANTMEDRRENDYYFTTTNNNTAARGEKRNGFNLFNAKRNRRGENNKNVEVLICPPAAFLSEVSQLVRFLYKKKYRLRFHPLSFSSCFFLSSARARDDECSNNKSGESEET
jgi:hypothetical protein